MSFKKSQGVDLSLSSTEQQTKINEVRKLIGPALNKFPTMCSDASILRFLRARNWHTKRSAKMLKEALIWRLENKPNMIRWDDIAKQAEPGKVYKANYFDKYGRTVLVMKPGIPEQMVWLIDFEGWNMSSISVKVTRETARLLQDCYPERLGLAILYNPPKVFESFWILVKPFLEKRTYKKVKFVYPNDVDTQKVMEDLFDMEKLESCFGGKWTHDFDYVTYSNRMREGDKMMTDFVISGAPLPSDQFQLSTDETTSNFKTSHDTSENHPNIDDIKQTD
ncbi:uncharacterized protein [Solanum lycopersicum]|uniref:Phosphatidylinositol transfer protein 3-like isoform X2 n=1 Tax=Solanum pennellii TaxID=28526 RepID=A0ABM1VIA3_SOLPN|nr:phosphatidylinositol transfer protein 3-like isoform X2 [Solanum lycopersicum]XP_027775471.1 phosphatidylinositol transfer protein 3-like isoform X2 [Solanum pennellii]